MEIYFIFIISGLLLLSNIIWTTEYVRIKNSNSKLKQTEELANENADKVNNELYVAKLDISRVSNISKILNDISVGDMVLYETELYNNVKNVSFSICAECEVIAFTPSKIKIDPKSVKILQHTSSIDVNSVISFLKDQWVNIKEVQVILDESKIREIKINAIVN